MDAINRKLLKLLQANARLSATALSKEIGLSRTAIQDRIARLEHEGIISGYTVRLGDDFSERFHKAILSVQIETRPCAVVLKQIKNVPAVEACFSVAGEIDAFVHVAYQAPRELTELIDLVSDIKGVGSVSSSVVLAQL